jgi:hypothetical protein
MRYENFDIRFAKAYGDQFLILAESNAGEDSIHIDLAAQMARLRDASEHWQSLMVHREGERSSFLRKGTLSERHGPLPDLKSLGREFFDGLLPQKLRSLLETSRAVAKKEGAGLRLRVHLNLRDEKLAWLASLPWELLCDSASDTGDFLALDGRTPVVRYLQTRQDRRQHLQERPWRILVVQANPQGSPQLDLEREMDHLRKTLGSSVDIELLFPERPTFDDVRRVLTKTQVHAIHFMGHGNYDSENGWGGLVLEKDGGGESPLSGPSLKKLIYGVQTPGLVVLNACDTARSGSSGGEDAFMGAAAALVAGGVSAVVAMQRPIGDEEAIHFSKILYERLKDGLPIDRAVSEARLSLSEAFADSGAWAIPALFMRVADGHLFATEEVAAEGPTGHGKVTDVANVEYSLDEIEDAELKSAAISLSGAAAEAPGSAKADAKWKIGKVKGGKVQLIGVERKGN